MGGFTIYIYIYIYINDLTCFCPAEKDMGILRRQIGNLNLDVSVTWVGSHLHSYVHHKTLQNKPVLFFNWVPNRYGIPQEYRAHPHSSAI